MKKFSGFLPVYFKLVWSRLLAFEQASRGVLDSDRSNKTVPVIKGTALALATFFSLFIAFNKLAGWGRNESIACAAALAGLIFLLRTWKFGP